MSSAGRRNPLDWRCPLLPPVEDPGRQCATCIYRPDSPLRERLPALEAEIADPIMPDHFRGARACHSESWPATDVICAGFAERHGDDAVEPVTGSVALRVASPGCSPIGICWG